MGFAQNKVNPQLHNALDKSKFIVYTNNTKLMLRRCTMFNFQIHSTIMYALNNHNNLLPSPRLTFLDGAILCLAKSFYEADRKLYMSNKELSKLFLSDPCTIQRSIDRLITAGLISKEKEYIASKQRRYLTYKPEAVNNLLNLV